LLTHSELMTVLHRQGFDGINEVERCVLEPGGTFSIQRKMPPVEKVEHEAVMQRLAELTGKVDRLLASQAGGPGRI
jgi:uncharacterized membrane protein YcaP (DUF421 family)